MNKVNLRFINFLTKEGKKTKAFSIFRKTMLILSKKIQENKILNIKNEIQTQYLIEENNTQSSDTLLPLTAEINHIFAKEIKIYKEPQSKKETLNPSLYYFVSPSKQSENTEERKSDKTNNNSEKKKQQQQSIQNISRCSLVFIQSINNIKPIFEVKRIRIGGSTYQVPSLVSFHRQESLAIRWIIQAARDRKKKNPKINFEDCLALEILEAFKKQGNAHNKRDDLHKIAEANRAYSYYRWW